MIPKEKIDEITESYGKRFSITTICSHTALQIFHGARQENVKTVGVATSDRRKVYESFPLGRPDHFIAVEKMRDILLPENQEKLIENNSIVVPHGSFVEYVGPRNLSEKFEVPMLGNRRVLEWESDREKQREWLKKAGCLVPTRFREPSEIDRPCLVKFGGAKGGRGFFVVLDEEEFYRKIGDSREYTIQEFITGTRYYIHYFYTPLYNEGWSVGGGRLELLSIDRRAESNIDELHRLGLTREEADSLEIEKSFVVTGNDPVVLRESLLPKIMRMGENIVKTSINLFKPGMLGPFCLETVCTPDLNFHVFEISARIVAGTNLYPTGSQYSCYLFDKPMSTGRRIAVELKTAAERDELDMVVY